MKKPKITVVVTCFNRENTIRRALGSILWQTFQDFEIIVVDDCSEDGSISAIESIGDSRIKIFKHNQNRGQNAALNTAITKSTCELIAFLDSDDIWYPEYLERMLGTFSDNIDFVYSWIHGGPKSYLSNTSNYSDVLEQGYLSSMISIIVRSRCFEKIGFFDETYSICQDDKFCFELSKYFKFKLMPEIYALAIPSLNSVTQNELRVLRGWERLFSDYWDEISINCGPRTLAKHKFFLCNLQIRSGMWLDSVESFFHGCKLLLRRPGKYASPGFGSMPRIFMSLTITALRRWSGRLRQTLYGVNCG